ncbi:MAG: glutamine amidotransferase [Kiritimatiellae bacterium]|nr:glutamine amidotransferase [Kiritimatiellia bacterium]MDD5522447.1 glutamine amidotransferase [Kiritimatiellia bacterium]
MAKVYYIGDWAVLMGPGFAESPFQNAQKGLDIFNYGKWLKSALESTGQHQVTSVPSWDFYKLGPGQYEEILESYDVIIFSDVEGKLFQLAPSFFDREKFGTRPLTFPDRLRLTSEAVQRGKGLMVLGGWYSYTGELGKGGWGRTRLREILPVKCLENEDLCESTEGFIPIPTAAGAKLFGDIDWSSCPPILGYNQTQTIPEGEILLKVKETGDPLLAIRRIGAGKVLAYTSDPAPHWGCNFVFWEHYNRFWLKCLELMLSRG